MPKDGCFLKKLSGQTPKAGVLFEKAGELFKIAGLLFEIAGLLFSKRWRGFENSRRRFEICFLYGEYLPLRAIRKKTVNYGWHRFTWNGGSVDNTL
jgi:hypothetical protein